MRVGERGVEAADRPASRLGVAVAISFLFPILLYLSANNRKTYLPMVVKRQKRVECEQYSVSLRLDKPKDHDVSRSYLQQ